MFIALNTQEKPNEKKETVEMTRRSFFKKAVYAAPTIVVMGTLLKSTKANARNTPSDPDQVSIW